MNATITGLNITANGSFWLRLTYIEVTGADDGLAIDNFTLMAQSTVATAPLTVPEPGSLVLAGVALLGLLTMRRRNRS